MTRHPARARKRALIIAAATAIPLSTVAASATAAPSEHARRSGSPSHLGARHQAPGVESRVKDVMTIGGREFRDLNDNGELDPYEDWRLPTKARAADLVSKMTLAEKAGLMQISSERGRDVEQGPEVNAEAVESITERHLRYFVIRDNPEAKVLASRANDYQEIAEGTRLGIPLVFASNPRNHVNPDQDFGISEATGKFSTWPGTLGLAATHDPRLVKRFGQVAAREWRASGIQKMYGYQVGITSEPRWRRIGGSFGEGVELVSDITTSLVEGFQGEELSDDSVALTIKHFPGDGPVRNGLDPHNAPGKWAVYPTAGSLEKYQLPPFQAAVDAGTNSIMSFYNAPSNDLSVPQLPGGEPFEEVGGAYNKALITDLLDDTMGFTGYVNSDSGILTDKAWGVEDLTVPERFAKAVRAGTSLFSDNNDPSGLLEAVDTGLLDESDLDESVTLLVSEMFELGLFEDPYTDPDRAQRIADSPASQRKADKANRKSVVLLRNDEEQLPLKSGRTSKGKLFVEVVAGEDAEKKTEAFKDVIRESAPTVDLTDDLNEAANALVWVMPDSGGVFDEKEPLSLQLGAANGVDTERVKMIEDAVPTTLAINMTNPWIIEEIEPDAAAVLATFDVKSEALVDVVRGRSNPSGGLPIVIPADEEAVENNAPDVPGYDEGPGYVYTDAAGHPYTLGFGLRYHRAQPGGSD